MPVDAVVGMVGGKPGKVAEFGPFRQQECAARLCVARERTTTAQPVCFGERCCCGPEDSRQ